ncbi:sterol desaturase family protein [Niabella beijingensis]|uniref:sterol desaturase family protein n=1 Tax=Niabella beijingensis TaxID=2872700 RepID=UPI001CBB5CF2|nr:sterol desaturase family protein [Niabella beijingensis]MBZ4191191.1 sterol desaturase family protein [Niabella beijingensis]
MQLNFIALAVPLFLFFMALEYRYALKKNKEVFHWKESIANLNVGIAERLCDLLTSGSFYIVFSWIHSNFGLFDIKPTLLNWILLFLATDLVWYWYHRFGHVVNLFWSAHVVHHQSDDFNYTVSARITVFQSVLRGLFWSILPLIGFPPDMTTILLLIHGAYPFFTHTQMIGKLGWIEYVFVTPSHHRVHHSSNPEYLDKNYGDVLIIWDKFFGTFKAEAATPVYGLTKPLNSHSFLWQHFHFLLELSVAVKREKGWRRKLKLLFGKPNAVDASIRPVLERKLQRKSIPMEPSVRLLRTISLQTTFTLTILFFTILFSHYLQPLQLGITAIFIFLSVIATGAMLEQKQWVFPLEYFRIVLLCLFLYITFPNKYVAAGCTNLLLILLLFYQSLKARYYSLYPAH